MSNKKFKCISKISPNTNTIALGNRSCKEFILKPLKPSDYHRQSATMCCINCVFSEMVKSLLVDNYIHAKIVEKQSELLEHGKKLTVSDITARAILNGLDRITADNS